MLESNNNQNLNHNTINCNDTEKIKNKTKKKKQKHGLLRIIFVYTIIAAIVTGSAILFYQKTGMSFIEYYEKEQNVEKIVPVENNEKNEEPKEIVRSKLTDKYYLNNLEIEEISEEIKKDYNYKNEDERSYKNKFEYIQISGLKSKKIENKINNEIEQTVKSLILLEELEDENIDYINISTYVNANFANLLSIAIDKTISYCTENTNEYNYNDDRIYLNYRLDTGEQLKFKDLFTTDAAVKNILSQNIYTDLAFEYGMEYIRNTEEYIDPDMDNVDYSKIENQVFHVLDDYNKGKDLKFCFSSSRIYIKVEETIIDIAMADYYEYINVFNLVNPEKSLYERGNLQKINYVFGVQYITNCEVFKKISDDIFLSIFSYYTIDEEDEHYQKFSKTVNENLHKIIEIIQKNEKMEYNQNGKGKIYNLNSVNESEDGIFISGEKVEVDLDNFDNQIDEVFSKASRREDMVDYFLEIRDYDDKENEYNIRIEENEDGALELFQLKDGEEM